MSKIESIKKKIKALRRKADDEASSESEIMEAIAKAEALMDKHNLTVGDLEEAALSGDITTGEWTKGTKKLHPVEYVANAVSMLSDTKGWVKTEKSKSQSLVFVGFSSDVEYALYLIDLIHNSMEAEWDSFRSGDIYKQTPRNQRSRMRDDFLRGMASRIREKIMAMITEQRVQATSGGTEVVVAKRGMIAEAMQEMGVDPKPNKRGKRKKIGPTAYYSGREAGERTNITTGITA